MIIAACHKRLASVGGNGLQTRGSAADLRELTDSALATLGVGDEGRAAVGTRRRGAALQ